MHQADNNKASQNVLKTMAKKQNGVWTAEKKTEKTAEETVH